MPIEDYLILIQNMFLLVFVTCPLWIQCKGKKKAPIKPGPNKSNETLMVKSAIKPPITDASASQVGPVKSEIKDTTPNEKSKKEESKDKKEDNGGGSKKNKSQKPFPKFEMPTESKKNKKLLENENDKKEKIKKGFYQDKSDEDDTLEKIDSLKVEQSDRTKRSTKNKKK